MISTIQNYQINDFNTNIDTTKIPQLSNRLQNLLKSKIELPPSPKTPDPLLNTSITSLKDTEKLLQETRNHRTRDKIISVLKVALVVAAIAGMILACTLGGPAGLGLGLSLGLVFMFIFYHISILNNLHKIIDIEKKTPTVPSYEPPRFSMTVNVRNFDKLIARFSYPLIALPIFPIYEAFTREARIEKILTRQQEAIAQKFSKLQEENSQLIPAAHDFYTRESDALIAGIEEQIEEARKDLTVVNSLPRKLSAGVYELENRIRQYEFAIQELREIRDFYLHLERSPIEQG